MTNMPSRILANRLHHTAYVTKDLEATRALSEILDRMQDHQTKKRARKGPVEVSG